VLFGLFPALHSTRPDLVTALRNNTGKLVSGKQANRFRATLVTAQIALSMALLTSAGLFIKSLRNVRNADLGIDVSQVSTFRIVPRRNGYDTLRIRSLYTRIEEELARIPGVTAVTASTVPLIAGSNWGTNVSVEGFKRDPDVDTESRYNLVGPGYFDVTGVKLLAGREFTDAENRRAARHHPAWHHAAGREDRSRPAGRGFEDDAGPDP
jgi:hypothetical protein